MSEKKLFLLDGMALIYRAYFAFAKNPRITSYGLNTSAIFGFANTLLEVLSKENPTHIAVVFDTAAPTQRHEEFEHYKAHREAMPEDLSASLPYVFKLIEAFNIPVITLDGYEADDIIGTLAKKAEVKGFTTYMMTPDKDYAQLVSEHIYMYKPAAFGKGPEKLGVHEVLAKWEIERVEQVIDILGLWGDSVDNIPGIPGIGEKTAKKLIAEYGSVEGIIEHSHELKGKQKENVENFAQQGLLSKKLATILLDVPIELDEKALVKEEANRDELQKMFAELEFKNMMKRVFGEEAAAQVTVAGQQGDLFAQPSADAPVQTVMDDDQEEVELVNLKTIGDVKHKYELVDTAEKRAKLIEDLKGVSEFCFDTETTDLNPLIARILGLAISFKAGEGFYVTFPEDKEESKAILAEFKPIFDDTSKTVIAQNIKYDMLVLANYDVDVKGKIFDTMIAHYLVAPDQKHNMDALSEKFLNYTPISITELIGKKGKNQLNMSTVPVEKVVDYAAEDADITFQLHEKIAPLLKEHNVQSVYDEMEIPLVPVLTAMEQEGIKVDTEILKAYSKELGDEVVRIEKEIYEQAGVQFNIASPKQLGEVLFDKMKLVEKPKKTKTGQYQTGEDILRKLANKHEIIANILDFRQYQKLKSTYVDALPLMVNPNTGRIHTTYSQTIAATGRLSSNEPNLQNIPIRTEKGREVRKAFVARNDDYTILSADYSQIELRIIASVSEDEGMMQAFRDGVDIHASTASKVFKVALDEVTPEMRRQAKAVNFGIAYGAGAFSLSENLDIPRKEAAAIIEEYFNSFPGIKRYMDTTINFAREHGYVQTLKGRRRYLRDINSKNFTVRSHAERNAINAPIQGSAADMIKLAMIHIHNEMKKRDLKSKMLLQVHDELLFDAHKSEVDELKALVKDLMENAMPISVPSTVEMGTGNNWLEAH